MNPKHTPDEPMALGNMRSTGVRGLTATLIAGLCCSPAPSEAYIEHPWCTRAGSTSCGFDSYEQCMENARLLTQTNCVANPWIHPLPLAPLHIHARGAAARPR